MFYSHSFLARKSPLGTVWIAAHLEKKLRKHQVSDTDLSSSIDCIMFPEVPIALRLSGHLLLGVVRIYSKKVEYLFQECNDAFKRISIAFASMQQVTLPENASYAPFHSITLPDKFDLEALDLHEELYNSGDRDDHTKDQGDITLQDIMLSGGDTYVVFPIDQERIDVPADFLDIETVPVEEDVHSHQLDTGADVSVSRLSGDPTDMDSWKDGEVLHNQFAPETETIRNPDRMDIDNSNVQQENEVIPQIEISRDFVHEGLDNLHTEMNLDNNYLQQKQREVVINEETLTPIIEEGSVSGLQVPPSQSHSNAGTVAIANSTPNFHLNSSFGYASHEMVVVPAPPVEEKIAKSRKRKHEIVVVPEEKIAKSRNRKHFFDTSVVLTNEFMKERLKDASKLVHKRKKLPCSALDVWKFNKRSRKEQVFSEPSISGLNTTLQNLFKRETFNTKTPLVQSPVSVPEHCNQGCTPEPQVETEHINQDPMPELNPEIEHNRSDGFDNSNFPPSPFIREELTPLLPSNTVSEPQTEVLLTEDTDLIRTVENTASSFGSEMETPTTQEQFVVGSTGLSDIPELPNSAEAEELNFLEEDGTPYGGYQKSEEAYALSTRTRAVAHYLKEMIPESGVSKEEVGNLSFNKILDGKTRKNCARMFYETLVLKSYDFIDVQQEAAYGDITIFLTSKLLKTNF